MISRRKNLQLKSTHKFNTQIRDDSVCSHHTESSRKTPLSIELLWEQPTSEPPIRWEKQRIQLQLAILTRENNALDTLLSQKPKQLTLPKEPKYEEPINDPTEQSEKDRQTRPSERFRGAKRTQNQHG